LLRPWSAIEEKKGAGVDEHGGTAGQIRRARAEDVPAMVALSAEKRRLYATYQPIFWAVAPDADAQQLPFFEQLVRDERTTALVHETGGAVDGFVIARLVASPPVYAPGGLTCALDDFWVRDPAAWHSAGRALLEAAMAEGRARGAVQSVVVCGQRDVAKRAMLQQLGFGFGVASEWWVRAP
jgi:GNAT superfamily N-acetyltransferase